MRGLLLLLLLLPGGALAQGQTAEELPGLEPSTAETSRGLPDLAALHADGWNDLAWTTPRNAFRARQAGAKPELWTRWPLPPRPGDRSLLVLDEAGMRLGLVFGEVEGFVRVEIVTDLGPEELVEAVGAQLGPGVAPSETRPLRVAAVWADVLTVVAEVDGGAAAIVQAPRALTDRMTLLRYEPWDREGPVPRGAARARLAIGVPLLATCFVSALALLPFATKQPLASIAVAAPLGAGISIGSALTISGATKLRGALPRAELEAWREAEAPPGSLEPSPAPPGPEPAPGLR
jgi:hypothetical protein